jgi:hypothetical protein
MAKHKAVINVSASVLPDWCKQGVAGSSTYNLNDLGNDNSWISWINNVDTNSQAIAPAGVQYINADGGDAVANTHATDDDVVFLVIKHTGYQSDNVTKTASSAKLYLNQINATAAANATSNMILMPGEVWWARFAGTTDLSDITVLASDATIRVEVYAVLDTTGV